MKALVTGGGGFIGSHIVDALLEMGCLVWVLDDLSTGSLANLIAHGRDPRLNFVRGDVRRINSIDEFPDGIDVVFHEAAIASVQKSVIDPRGVHDVNVNASLEVMDFCRKRDVRRFVFASSAAVYGTVPSPPPLESDSCAPVSPYGASKLAVEKYMHAYAASYGLETVALRYFNVYGPRQRMADEYGGVIPVFSRQLLEGVTPTVYGDGMQTRDFVNVKDVVRANLLAMVSEKAPKEVFNVASGTQVTILKLFELLARASGSPVLRPKFAPSRAGDTKFGMSSIEKAKRVLGYEPMVSLEEGLTEVLDYVSVSAKAGLAGR
jgi:nucleoside-diphosphate-sugar epimerase